MNNPFVYFLLQVCMPILIALVVYLVTLQLGEWKRRRSYCKLGVIILDTLQEELVEGIESMWRVKEVIKEGHSTLIPGQIHTFLPSASWSGTSTITDEIILRLIETEKYDSEIEKVKAGETWSVTSCRTHCKNYFDHMCAQYNDIVKKSVNGDIDWKDFFSRMLDESNADFIGAANNVHALLERAKKLLSQNAKRWFPK